jgi:hypothetical protein
MPDPISPEQTEFTQTDRKGLAGPVPSSEKLHTGHDLRQVFFLSIMAQDCS